MRCQDHPRILFELCSWDCGPLTWLAATGGRELGVERREGRPSAPCPSRKLYPCSESASVTDLVLRVSAHVPDFPG